MTKPPVARELAVRHTKLVCLTASFLASGFKFFIISKCMHGIQACLFKYSTVAAFHIYAQRGEDASKGDRRQNQHTQSTWVSTLSDQASRF